MSSNTAYSFAERIMLQHSYLPKLALDCLGIVLGAYLLWQRQVLAALGLLIGLSILGNIVAWKQDIHALSETKLGQWMLIQARPANLIIRTLGAAVLAYGLWLHSAGVILCGVGIIVLARFISNA